MTEVLNTQPDYRPPEEVPVFVRGGQSDQGLKLSLDRKVSPKGWYQAKEDRWVAKVPNSFGLPAGETCPGKTEFCNGCYAVNSERSMGVADLVDHNYQLLLEAESVDEMSDLLTEMVTVYDAEADRLGVAEKDKIFRIHWDGDFFSEDYAKAWAKTIPEFPDTTFWVYTRSFVHPVDVIPYIVGLDNLTVYLSVDKYNIDVAKQIKEQYPEVGLAYCAEDYRSARELAEDSGRRTLICPENNPHHPYELMNRERGTSNGRGACVDCRWCPDNKVDVIFSTDHVEDTNPQLSLLPEVVSVELIKKPTIAN